VQIGEQAMKYARPKLALPDGKPPQSRLMPKFGGLPWGFPAAQWPICEECAHPMHLVAQLPGDVPGLDIVEGEVLHVFRCCWSLSCDRALMDAGIDAGKAAVTLAQTALGRGLTRPPLTAAFEADLDVPGGLSGGAKIRESAILPELWITGFDQVDDGIEPALYPQFLQRETHDQMPTEVAYPADFDSAHDTKFGGWPYWSGNGVMDDRLEGATFLFSIGSLVYPDEPIPKDYRDFDQGGPDHALLNVADSIEGDSYGIFHDFCYNAPLLLFRLADGRLLQVLAR